MSQSVNPDPDPDPWIKPGWELLQLQRNQWDSPRKRHLQFWGWARLVHRTALTSRYLLKHPLLHSHPHCLCCRRKATPYFIKDPSSKTNSKSRRLHVSQHLFSLHVIINLGALCITVKRLGSGLPGFESWYCHLLAVWPQAHLLTSLCPHR